MSASVVTEDHVKQLALAWGQWDRWNRRDHKEIVETARELMRENIRSVKVRYPDSDELPGPIETPEAETIDISIMVRCRLTPVMALKMADCLEYQSCETGWDNWIKTKAYAILQTVRSLAVSKLPGYDDAPWAYRQQEQDEKAAREREEAKTRIRARMQP